MQLGDLGADVVKIERPGAGDEAPPPQATSAPLLGRHTDAVLAGWLGLARAAIDDYAGRGAFGRVRMGAG